jgi:predicted acylesterase/phospholipase RssA
MALPADAASGPIGRPNEPLRVLSFASGGFETVRQLGAVHALLVSGRCAPDLVIGSSAGAVNAVAAAEILQAGKLDAPKWEQLEARVARFREVFESYQNCPGDLAAAMLPDTYEIDVHRPLEQLRLPIQAEQERIDRAGSFTSRAGILNLYNDLLRLRISIATATRFVRRYLGFAAAGAEPNVVLRWLVRALELFRTWVLAGTHLGELAPLGGVVARAAFGRDPGDRGAPAAHLIFRSKLFQATKSAGIFLVSFAVLLAGWVVVSSLMLAPPTLLFSWLSTLGGCAWSHLDSLPGTGWRVWPFDRSAPPAPGVALATDLVLLLLAAVIRRSKLRAATAPDRRVRPRVSTILLALLPALGAIAALYCFAVLVSTLHTSGSDDPVAPLAHNLAVATAGMLVLGLLAAVVAAAQRETSQVDEFLGVLGGTLGFLAIYWAVLGLLVGSVKVGVPSVGLAWIIFAVWQLLAVCLVAIVWCGPTLPVNLLKNYDIANALGSEHPIRRFLTRLFDPEHYGRTPMNTVLERAMEYSDRAYSTPSGKIEPPPKKLGDYARGHPSIHVAVTAAEVTSTPNPGGESTLRVLGDDTPVIEGLLAAIAVAPFLPPRRIGDGLYVDAANLANEPTGAALDYLRQRMHAEASCVHLYSVTHLPFTRASLERVEPREYAQLLNVVYRARELERFRDATLDRRLTHLFSRTLPDGPAVHKVDGRTYLRARIFPMEPEDAGKVNQRIVRAGSDADRSRIIAETVADGCRTALETMLRETIRSRVGVSRAGVPRVLKCGRLIASLRDRDGALAAARLPGSAPIEPGVPDPGPGLAEVCEACALARGTTEERARTLRASAAGDPVPDWPAEGCVTKEPAGENLPAARKVSSPPDLDWPRRRPPDARRGTEADRTRPTVSLLFSGGVFRGVYQMGALNALNEAGLEPDVIAGASVGSITAAMIARVFREPPDDPAVPRFNRRARIARLAAVYLGVDRLVMTDRFADFIRAVTVRAAHTRFSIRDADRVFRRYDSPWTGVYEREARRVFAGVERLCYVSPFELKDLIEAIRRGQHDRTSALLRRYVQEWFNRLGVGNQVLGAEPLQLLIQRYVLDGLPVDLAAPANTPFPDSPFDAFLKDGICFLATVTNLTAGRLEVLGCDQLKRHRPELLGQGLLASSAFPAVFRPRWSWEFLPGNGMHDRYIDGGVTDNLPLDAVAEFLYEASKAGIITRRPAKGRLPHLLLATSLEPRLESLSAVELEKEIQTAPPGKKEALERKRAWAERRGKELERNWPALYRRASRLKYNLKLDVFTSAQQALRDIVQHRKDPTGDAFEPLDLEVIAVKPAWLPGTFAFHPMMGFRRERQARSIAHGCRTTLLKLGELYHGTDAHPAWGDAWGLDRKRLPQADVVAADPVPLVAPKHVPGSGDCWIRPNTPCPFAARQVREALMSATPHKDEPKYDLAPGDMDRTVAELEKIYVLCGEAETHQRKDE